MARPIELFRHKLGRKVACRLPGSVTVARCDGRNVDRGEASLRTCARCSSVDVLRSTGSDSAECGADWRGA